MKRSLSLFLSFTMFLCCCLCIFTATLEIANENRYAVAVPYGGIIEDRVTDTVYYHHKDESEIYVNPNRLPAYMASGIDNSCAITAGGAIIGHYDMIFEELIPNHTAIEFMGHYTYASQDAAVNAMHQDLRSRMGSTSEGTTVAGYKSGMASYVNSKGRNLIITGIYRNSSLNKSLYMPALESGKLLTVFMDGFAIISNTSIETYDGYDTIYNTIVRGKHCVAAYGYKNIKYYDASNNLIQEDDYLYVHTGFSTGTFSMIRLTKYITIKDGYILEVY